MTEMSPRERTMAMIVGAAAFVVISYLVVDYFLSNQTRLRGELARNTAAISAMRRQLAEKPMWDQREAWLKAKQPTLASEDTAGVQLLDRVKEVAKKNAVQISSQALRPPTHTGDYSSIGVELETTSTWPSLIGLLRELQGPEQFIVFEGVNLKIDDKDATQMRGSFKIAKWYAPKPKFK
jgi:Type II secretion system (T2SS), protein M subtype b